MQQLRLSATELDRKTHLLNWNLSPDQIIVSNARKVCQIISSAGFMMLATQESMV